MLRIVLIIFFFIILILVMNGCVAKNSSSKALYKQGEKVCLPLNTQAVILKEVDPDFDGRRYTVVYKLLTGELKTQLVHEKDLTRNCR